MNTLPHVVFYKDSKEDREASIKAGMFVAAEVDMVKISPRGTKDNVQKEVSEWFASLEAMHSGARISSAVLGNYREAYEAWKKGEEIPEHGLSVKNWPVATPAQVATLIAMKVTTVEQLAAANEQIIAGLGLHGRILVQRAQSYLKEAANVGKSVMLMEKLQTENSALKDTIIDLSAQLEAAKKLIPAATATKG